MFVWFRIGVQGMPETGGAVGGGRRLKELEDAVSKERRQISELEHKYTLTLHQLDLATSREEQLRNEARDTERNLALIKHELKEVPISAPFCSHFFPHHSTVFTHFSSICPFILLLVALLIDSYSFPALTQSYFS